MDSCSSCKFYLNGLCRRFPPQITRGSDGKEVSDSPWVAPTEWCGEYVRTISPDAGQSQHSIYFARANSHVKALE